MDVRTAVLVVVVVTAGTLAVVGTAEPVAAQSCQFPYTATDATGTAVTVEEPPERIVVLGASSAQTLWELGARDEVVGMPVQPYTAYLEGAEDRTPVMHEDGFTVNVEVVVDLDPDLVLAPSIIDTDTVEQLRDAGLTVFRFGLATSIEDVYAETRRTGELTGYCDEAEATVTDMRSRIEAVQTAVADEPRPRVIYPLGGGFVAGEGTFIDDMLTTAGAENVAARANITGYQPISPEVIVEQDPEWIVRSSDLPESELATEAYNTTTAVREDQVVVVDANLANQAAPRVVEVIETIASALHPEAYPPPTPTATSSPAEPQPSATPTATAGDGTTSTPGQPGFGVLVSLVALGGLLLAGRLHR